MAEKPLTARQIKALRLINLGPAQETRLAVVVVEDDLEHERAGLARVLHEREEEAIGTVQPGSVELPVPQVHELLYIGRLEVPAPDGFGHLFVL